MLPGQALGGVQQGTQLMGVLAAAAAADAID